MRLTPRLRRNRIGTPVVRATARSFTFPAPTGGWNTRDPLSGMNPADAVNLDNYFPTTADVELRGGSEEWASGMGSSTPVETLMDYSQGTTSEMWAIAGGSIFDVSNQAAVGAAAVTGLTNSRWQSLTFETSSAVPRLVLVNGEDNMLQYDGTNWDTITGVSAPIAITGVDTADLIQVWSYQTRLFFVEKNTMNAWYLPADSYGGAAAKLNLGSVFKKGGYLMAGGTWTRDSGDGMDDLCVFISSKGEVAIYQGTDPSDSANWSKIGLYVMGAPVGRRCTVKTGSDLAIICLDGIVGISTIISLDRAESNKVALSSKIQGSITEATSMYANNFGWEAIAYPAKNMVLFNIPIAEGVTQYQYTLNALTGAWCRFKGWNANCWCLHNERIYFGNNTGSVILADEGEDDQGSSIDGLIKTAFSYFKTGDLKKEMKLVKPILFSDFGLAYGIDLALDFSDSITATIPASGDLADLSVWNEATWNVDPWAVISELGSWKKVNGVGRCAAVIFTTSTQGYPIRVSSITVLFEIGGIL